MRGVRWTAAFCACAVLASAGAAAGAPADHASYAPALKVLEAGNLGPYSAQDFRLVDGACGDCASLKPALWYFGKDLVAVPRAGVPLSSFSKGVKYATDAREWYAQASDKDNPVRPGLVWIGSPYVVAGARIDADASRVRVADDESWLFEVVSKIPANRSYFDASTARFFAERPLRIRGQIGRSDDLPLKLTARTIWPEDYVIDGARLDAAAPVAGDTLSNLVKASGEAANRYETRLLWERRSDRTRGWAGRPVIAVMLNGAQGDDDEAHGGHFAIATGMLGARGDMADWLVNNFYNLDSYSEKGIIAAMTPMDNYLADLNSGQSYYRPSYMLVAILRSERAALAYQQAVARVYDHFYRHDFRYRHSGANCAGVSVDTFGAIGWNVPPRGPTSRLKAVAAYPYMAAKDHSLESGRKAFEYLAEEQVRLYPMVAFEALGQDLLHLVGALPGAARKLTAYEKMLQDEVDAVVFVRIPQFPSSRAKGTYPVASIDEYMKRVPEDRAQWKIVPVDARPFPAEFRDEYTEAENASDWTPIAAGAALAGFFLIAWTVRARKKRKAG